MFLVGTIVNSVAILIGSIIGAILPSIPERMKNTIMQGIALCVFLIGLTMAISDKKDILIMILSIVIGGVIGEVIDLEGLLLKLGNKIEHSVKKIHQGPIAESFVASTLLFCVGSMAIVGAIQNGITGNETTLFAKSILDGVSSLIFTSTLGIGVALSAIPVFLYEGSIALISHLAGNALNDPAVIACMTATGGLLIMAIGLNLYGIKKVSVGNLLPAILISILIKVSSPDVVKMIHQLS